jgi:hypothetical protein
VVSLLTTGFSVVDSGLAEDGGFLWVIKIRGQVKPLVPYRRFTACKKPYRA